MAKAAPAEQLKLLELQGLDAKLKSLSNRRRSLESDSRITDLEAALSVANGELGAAKVAVHDAELDFDARRPTSSRSPPGSNATRPG